MREEERKILADTKVSEDGRGGGVKAEIPLQPVENMRQALLEVDNGVDILLQAMEDPMPEQV